MATSTIKKGIQKEIKTVTKTGTTNAGGNFSVGDSNMKIISATATGSANRMFIPFVTEGVTYLKVLDWNSSTYSPVANGAVSVRILYVE